MLKVSLTTKSLPYARD